ncbi:phospholipase D-like domain-containing protein [Trichormus sp. NMC-1]|uniref:phospholipase D-like domain-containing protein n=1 Tax=Trichormus sp. NMC-1 TaxID=1853259 RepID=UPI0008DC2374|nr:phospholipase D-like domain-containing protein [Trichormus sp. NMC-1]
MTYKLIYDAKESLEVFKQALSQVQDRLIMVCPWLQKYVIDEDIVEKIENLLNSGVRIDIGYGYNLDFSNLPSNLSETEFYDLIQNPKKRYTGLQDIYTFEVEYKKYFKLKLIGTHEKYLVCDNKFAMIGSHNFLSSKSQVKEIGIYTTDNEIIQELIEHYDNTPVIITREKTCHEYWIEDCLDEFNSAMSDYYSNYFYDTDY